MHIIKRAFSRLLVIDCVWCCGAAQVCALVELVNRLSIFKDKVPTALWQSSWKQMQFRAERSASMWSLIGVMSWVSFQIFCSFKLILKKLAEDNAI